MYIDYKFDFFQNENVSKNNDQKTEHKEHFIKKFQKHQKRRKYSKKKFGHVRKMYKNMYK